VATSQEVLSLQLQRLDDGQNRSLQRVRQMGPCLDHRYQTGARFGVPLAPRGECAVLCAAWWRIGGFSRRLRWGFDSPWGILRVERLIAGDEAFSVVASGMTLSLRDQTFLSLSRNNSRLSVLGTVLAVRTSLKEQPGKACQI